MNDLDQLLRQVEVVSPEEFTELVRSSPNTIAESTFVPPDLESDGWGHFEIKKTFNVVPGLMEPHE